MKALLAPRYLPLAIWLLLASMAALCVALLLQGSPRLSAAGNPSDVTRTQKRDVQQAQADLKALSKVSTTPPTPHAAKPLIAPVRAEVGGKADLPPVVENETPLKGAVVVFTDTQKYILIGPQRYRVGDALPGGEIIKRIRPDAVDIAAPKGKARVIKLEPAFGTLVGSQAPSENHEKKH
jgi:hypothetical protein